MTDDLNWNRISGRLDVNLISALPPNERDDGWILELHVNGIGTLVRDYETALAVFEDATQQREIAYQSMNAANSAMLKEMMDDPINSWLTNDNRHAVKMEQSSQQMRMAINVANLAGRDACVTLSNIHDRLCAIKKGLERCPTVRALVSLDEVQAIIDQFKSDFPALVVARDSAVHRVDKIYHRESFAKNSADGPFELGRIKSAGNTKNIMILASMMGRAFCGTGIINKKGGDPAEPFSLELFTQSAWDKIKKVETEIYSTFQRAETAIEIARRGRPRNPVQPNG